MATEVVMPQMGESIAEGTITRWLKKVGEGVERDEPLFEISTDKVDAEIPSPAAGTLTEIKFKEGETVEVNKVVAIIGTEGEQAAAPPPATTATTAATTAQATAAESAPAEAAPAAQAAAEAAGAVLRGHEAVEQPLGVVLGQVDDARGGIDRRRLVHEAPHPLQRHGVG